MTICEKAAYLTGLFDGKALDMTKPEGIIISELVKLVKDMANEIADLQEETKNLREYIEEIDEDLAVIEDEFYDEDEDDDYYDEDEDEEDDDFYEVECPSCGEVICFDDSVDPDDVMCPACGEKFSCVCDCECDECEGCDEE